MICVLSSRTPRYNNSCARFTEGGSNLPTNRCVDYEFNNWVNGQKPRHENPRYSSLSKTEANTSSVVQYEAEISCGSATNFQQDNVCITTPRQLSDKKVDSDASHEISTVTASVFGVRHQPESTEMCNTSETTINNIAKQGVKRKLNYHVTDEDYVPVKRIFPFPNTQKEERKKVLKITVKKLRLIVDPNRYLRKAVVMNNTLKKIQRELKEEKKQTQKDAYVIAGQLYGILANSCLPMYDDLFFNCAQQEKLSEEIYDLSHSLLNNLQDKLCDNTDGCADISSNTKQSAPVEFSNSIYKSSYEFKKNIENETTSTHQSDKVTYTEQRQKGSQMDSNKKMDINPCSYQSSNIECLDNVRRMNPQSRCDRGITFHDTLPSSSNMTVDDSNSIGAYRVDSLERDMTLTAIAHLEAIASDSGNLDNFDISHLVDNLTAAHSFFSPLLVFDPIHQTVH